MFIWSVGFSKGSGLEGEVWGADLAWWPKLSQCADL